MICLTSTIKLKMSKSLIDYEAKSVCQLFKKKKKKKKKKKEHKTNEGSSLEKLLASVLTCGMLTR